MFRIISKEELWLKFLFEDTLTEEEIEEIEQEALQREAAKLK
tara:strand:- start:1899 stop:2024 length:126 start_codon:yes stop_codon:yes gene_type:complete